MAITEQVPDTVNRQRIAYAVLGAIALGLVIAIVAALRPTPQLIADEDVFKTVDALYTAVRMKDEKRLGECERKLQGFRDAKKLSDESAEVLDGVIAKARSGRWESAAERLYDFMLAQRREGPETAAPKHDHKPSPKAKR